MEAYFTVLDEYLVDFFARKAQWLAELEEAMIEKGAQTHNSRKKEFSLFENRCGVMFRYSSRVQTIHSKSAPSRPTAILSSYISLIRLHSLSAMDLIPNITCERIYPILPDVVDESYKERLLSLEFDIFRYVIPITRDVFDIKLEKQSLISNAANTTFRTPWDIAIHPITGDLYIAEQIPSHVSIFTPLFERKGTIGSQGTLPGMFRNPTSVAWSPDVKHFIVVDNSNHRIQIYDQHLAWMREIGKCGKRPGEFNNPFFARFADDGSFYVTDRLNHRIQKLDLMGACLMVISLLEYTLPTTIPDSILMNDHGQLMVLCSEDPNIHVFDVSQKVARHRIIHRELTSRKPSFLFRGPNGGFGVCCPETGIQFHSLDERLVRELPLVGKTAAAFAPSGQLFLLSKSEHSITEM